MNKRRIHIIFILLTSVFGLISCKSESPVVIQGEQLKIGGLKSQNKDKSYNLAKDLKELELAGRLTIGSLEKNNFENNPLTIKMESRCQGTRDKQIFRYTTYWQNTAHLPVLELISKGALLLSDPQSIHCDFTMTVSNTLSSSHTSEIQKVKIKDWSTFHNFNISFLEENLLSYSKSPDDILVNNPKEQHVHLSCKDFSLSSRKKDIYLELLLGRQLEGLNLSTPTQNCRLLVDHKKNRLISKPFLLKLPFEPLVAHLELTGINAKDKNVDSLHVSTAKIYNTNSFPLVMSISKKNNMEYFFRPSYFLTNGFMTYLGGLIQKPIQWTPRIDSRRLSQNADSMTFEVKANEEITIDGLISFQKNCQSNIVSNIGDSAHFTGYNFTISPNSQFQILAHPDRPTDMSVVVNYPKTKTSAPYPYWKLFSDPNIIINYVNGQKNSTQAQLTAKNFMKIYFQGGTLEPKLFNNQIHVSPIGCR